MYFLDFIQKLIIALLIGLCQLGSYKQVFSLKHQNFISVLLDMMIK